MSLTSCFKYVIELPVATLQDMVRAAVSQDDTSGAVLTRHWEGIPVGEYTATVDVRPEDVATDPPGFVLTPAPLGISVHMVMRMEVDVDQLPNLDAIVYRLAFDLPGTFEKDATSPPVLFIRFPAVTAGDLGLSVSGGQIPLTPELIEPQVHAMYAANPSLGHTLVTGIAAPPPIGETVAAEIDIYDQTPPEPHITVRVDSAVQVTLVMPGHFRLFGVTTTYMNTDMTVEVALRVEQADGSLTVFLKNDVQASDVTVTFATPSIYDVAARPILANQIAAKLSEFENFVETFPTAAEVRALIESRLVDLATELSMPIFTPQPPASGDIDLTTFEPLTIAEQVLALQLEPLGDGTPCDGPDVFARETGFAIAVSAGEVNRMIEPIVTNNTGDHHIEGYDMTVQDLSATLSDPGEHGEAEGHLWIEGTTEVHVDCWADPEIDFWGPIQLDPSIDLEQRLVFTADAGGFGADDPCCADVDPSKIAALIEGEESTPMKLPTDFSGVGTLNLGVSECDISRAGLVVHGSLTITTIAEAQAATRRSTVFWFTEMAGGG